MSLTVVTYGGGEILRMIFDAIAMLSNQSGGIVKPLMYLCAVLGGFWSISKALFAPSLESLLLRYFFPLIVVCSLFFIPTTSIRIEDVLKDRSYKVDHVPFLLARFAELTSTIGYKITDAFEKVMHVPNDISYNSTGMIFGADNAMDIGRYQLTNSDLEQNLRRFSKKCVLYDIALGQYSIDDLKKSTDLWKFFEEKTSQVRMIEYCDPDSSSKKKKCEYLSCKEAFKRMTPYFNKEKEYFAQLEIVKNLPLTFQALTGLQKEKEDLIGQQLMIHLLKNEYNGNAFAKSRAESQQKNTYQTMGALAANGLVVMRAVIEALVYAAFILIFPLALLPSGFKYFSTWAWLAIWIQLWPPFYAILNYIMHSVAHGYVETVFFGLNESQKGLSFFTSVGLKNLQEDIFALAGYLSASIPLITYAILQGGMSSFVQVANSMMSPSQSAASTVGSEQATGNYSLANSNFGQLSYQNSSSLQGNLAPSFSAGYFVDNQGESSSILAGNEHILRQGNSELRSSILSDDSISQSFQRAEQQQQSYVDSTQKSFTESVNSAGRMTADLTEHLANSKNYSENMSTREGYDVQESARYLQSMSENWGKQYGLNSRESMEFLGGLSIGGIIGQVFKTSMLDQICSSNFSGSNSVSRDEVMSSALNMARSEDFQKNLQNVHDFSESRALSSSQDEGVRLSQGYNHSIDNVKASQEAYQSSLSHLNQISDNASWAKNNSQQVRRSLNQDFVNWASDQLSDQGGFSKVNEMLSKGGVEADNLVNQFVDHVRSQTESYPSPQGFITPERAFANSSISELNREQEVAQMDKTFMDLGASSGLIKGEVAERGHDLEQQKQQMQNQYSEGSIVPENISKERNEFSQKFNEESNSFLVTQAAKSFYRNKIKFLFEAFDSPKNVIGEYQMKETPFWMDKE